MTAVSACINKLGGVKARVWHGAELPEDVHVQGLVRNDVIAGAENSRSGCLVCIHRGTMSLEIASRQVV